MRAAAGRLLHGFDHVAVFRVYGDVLTELFCERQFIVRDIDRDDLKTHDFRILNRQVPEPADAGDRDPIARAGAGLLDAFIRRDAGADDRCGGLRSQPLRNMRDVVGIGENVLGEAAVTRVAAKLRLRTNGLPSRETVFTVPTRRVEPRHADPIAFLHILNILTDRAGDPDTFVTRNERQRGFERPIAARSVEIRMAHAARTISQFGL